jgi:hypothetical protein
VEAARGEAAEAVASAALVQKENEVLRLQLKHSRAATAEAVAEAHARLTARDGATGASAREAAYTALSVAVEGADARVQLALSERALSNAEDDLEALYTNYDILTNQLLAEQARADLGWAESARLKPSQESKVAAEAEAARLRTQLGAASRVLGASAQELAQLKARPV